MIFAAGLGTRLKPLTDTLPKALVPLAGKTLLQWQIEKLKAAGIKDIVVNVHHFPDMIINYLRDNDNFGCNILVSDERETLLETGGGLRKAQPLFSNSETSYSPILICNVDILSNIECLVFHCRKKLSNQWLFKQTKNNNYSKNNINCIQNITKEQLVFQKFSYFFHKNTYKFVSYSYLDIDY